MEGLYVSFNQFVEFPDLLLPSSGTDCCSYAAEVEISTHVGSQASRWRCFSVLHQVVRPEAIRDAGCVYPMAVKSAQNL